MKKVFIYIILMMFLGSCINHPDYKYNDIKWMYYLSNHMCKGIQWRGGASKDLNVCFIDSVRIDTLFIGDTLEYTVTAIYKGEDCYPYNMRYNTFGYYPNSKTINYRTNNCCFIYKRISDDYYVYKDPFTGKYKYNSIKEDEKSFILFIRKNKGKINKWIEEEAIRRGFIEN